MSKKTGVMLRNDQAFCGSMIDAVFSCCIHQSIGQS
jgi:hypothetical protein